MIVKDRRGEFISLISVFIYSDAEEDKIKKMASVASFSLVVCVQSPQLIET